MHPRRWLFWLGLAAAMAIGIGLRLSTKSQLTSGGRARALSSDDDYHLRRARFAAAHYPRTIVFDPLMNFPQGGVAIWPPLFDVALATPARLLHGSSTSADQVERGALWVPVVFAGGAILLAGLLGRVVAGGPAGAALALFVAICPGHILWTQYGHTDQHVAESFFGLLVLWLFLRSRSQVWDPKSAESDGPRPRKLEPAAWSELWTGVALALAVLAWQGAIYWGAIIALSLVLEAALTGRSVLRPAVLIPGLAAVLTAPATALWLAGARVPLTYISFGFFQPLFLAALCGGTALADTLLAAARRRLTRQSLPWRIAAIGGAALIVLPFAGALWSGLARGIGYVAGQTSEVSAATGYVSYPKNWLSGIFEARPLLADGLALPVKQLSAAFFLAPLVILLWAARARSSRPGVHVALVVWGGVTLFLALSQRLNVYYAAPLAGLCLIEAAGVLAHRLRTTPRSQTAVALACGVALALPMVPGIREEVSTLHVPGSDLFDTLEWMRARLPHSVDAYDERLLHEPPPPELARAASVLAPWSLGHLILYNAELPVVANNFGYGFLDSIRFFLAESEEEAMRIARDRRARWLLVTDLVPRMNDYAGYLGRAPYLANSESGPQPTPRYFTTLQSRLYDFDGAGLSSQGLRIEPLAHFRLLFHSRSAIRRGGRWLARWKVFEVVP
jgi:asparagine N-glycosylation enzyme membrane subunit Stt3